ncbi:MAG: hypothetical protein PF487_12195 [Bacteroidales bacterium]|jgi:hypothetical protein|nr:hypothetical protein [Bacteroidales bacterium]
MIKVVTFNKTRGSEKFKEFLASPFKIDMLYQFNDQSTETLFEDWRGKDMINWHKFTNDDYTLEFYPTYYTLKKNKPLDSIKYMMSIPKTIDDFINDMDRFGVELYWTNWIDQNFEPKEYLSINKIKTYFTDLLTKMGKSEELL